MRFWTFSVLVFLNVHYTYDKYTTIDTPLDINTDASVRENVWGNSKKRKKSCFFWIL